MTPIAHLRRTLAAAACAALLVTPAAGRAGDLADLDVEELLALEVVVTSASKHEESLARAPASVTVVTAEEIRDQGKRTLAEVLDGVRGFFVTDDRNYAYAGVRGFDRPGDYGTRVLLLVDGHQVNDNLYDSAFIGNEFPVDLELVERVEIVRGPASALYGGNAMFAVVNVVTRAPAARGASASLSGGSLGAKRARAEWGGAAATASLSAYDSAGATLTYPELAAAPGGGVVRGLDWERGGRAFAKASLGGFRLLAAIGLREKGIPTAAFGVVPGDPRSWTRDLRGFAEVAWDGLVAPDLHLTARAYADEFRYRGGYPQPDGAGSSLLWVDDHVGRWVGTEERLRWQLGEHALVAGVEARANLRQAMRSGNVGLPPELDFARSRASGAGYAQAELRPCARAQATAGVRWDVQPDQRGVASPRLALVVEPLRGTTLKALRGAAFRAPNLYERYYWAPDPTRPFQLKPERIHTSELVLEQEAWAGARLSANVYAWTLYGIVESIDEPNGDASFRNGGKVSARGAELELEQRLAGGSVARASWAVQRTREASGAELTNSPRHLARLQLAAPAGWDPFHGGLELRWMSARRTLAGGSAGAHLVADVTASLRGLARGRLDLTARVKNLLDAAYGDPGSTEHLQDLLRRDGRTFDVELVARF